MNAMYLRKSRADDPSASIEEVLAMHRKILEELAERKGIYIDDVFEEVVSGESLSGRPEMLKLLKGVQAGLYDAVVCMDIDRLGRGGMADQGVILDAFRDSETLIITPDKSYDLSDEMDEELTEFKAFMARREYKMIRKRMQRGKMHVIESGAYVPNAPYGYKKCTINKMPSLEIVEEEAWFIRYIFNRYLSGVGATTIVAELNAMGSVPRRGDAWVRSSLRHILRNPTFAGKVAWNRVKHYRPGAHGLEKHHVVHMPEEDWILVDGLHEAIISWEDWLKVQEIRKRKYIPSQNTGKIKNPFAGLIVCPKCGKNMQMMGCNKGVSYLLCNTKSCQAGAQIAFVEEHLIDQLHEMLEAIKLAPEAAVPPAQLQALSDQIASLEKEIEKLDSRMPKLYELLEDGVYDKATFALRKEATQKEKAALERRKLAIEEELHEIKSADMKKTGEVLESVLRIYPTLEPDGKNMLLKSVIAKVEYNKEKKSKPRDLSLAITLEHI